jgi:hypothetical protein
MANMRLRKKKNSYGDESFYITNAKLLRRPYRNFEGRPSKVHPNGGVREFGVIIEDPEIAQQLAAFGFNIKTRTNRDGADGEEEHWLSIKVAYYKRNGDPVSVPPKFTIRTANNECYYEEQNIKELDSAELVDVNIKFNPYFNEIGGKQYVTPYLSIFEATMIEDNFFFDDDEDDGLPFSVE